MTFISRFKSQSCDFILVLHHNMLFILMSLLGGMVALPPHSKKVLGSFPGRYRAFQCGIFMFSPCSRGFSLGALVYPTVKTCTLGLSPVITLDQDTGSESGVGPLALHCDCPLLLRDGIEYREHILPYTVYVNDKIPLPFRQYGGKCHRKQNLLPKDV